MGRRKERRLAAISAAGRRVKLDLFAEPTEVSGKSLHDDAGEDLGQEKCADVPTSPLSSDQKQENPLLLLGQYSDDEVDESSSKRQKLASDGTPLAETSLEVDQTIDSKEQPVLIADPYAADNLKLDTDGLTIQGKLDGIVEESTVLPFENKIQSSTEKSPLEDSSMQVPGDFSSEWKIVMHEESKSYYYWNTQTGETSWEVPNVLSNAENISGVTSKVVSHLGPDLVDTDGDGLAFVSASACACATVDATGKESGEISNIIYDSSQTGLKYEIGEASGYYCMTSTDYSSEHFAVSSDHETHGALMPQVGEDTIEVQEGTCTHSTQLIKTCEDLLDKLKAIEGFDNHISQQTWTYKYVIELETRLSDCRSLLSFGSSIIPFWRNTELQLQRIRSAIMENLGVNNFGYPGEVGDPAVSLNDNPSIVEKEGGNALTPVTASKSPEQNLPLDIGQCPVGADIRKSESPKRFSDAEFDETISDACIEESICLQPVSKVDFDAQEDIDMDVEMELDDDIPNAPLHTVEPVGTEQPCSQLVHDGSPPVPSEDFIVPPPPDEDWVSPPPPDGDQDPPPPSEEPPSIPVAPYPEAVHHLPYTEHYDTGYSAPSYQYYTSTVTETQNASYYSHIDDSHVVQTQNPEYFGTMASTSYLNAPAVVSGEVAMLYEAHGGMIPPGPVSTDYESSVTYADPGFSNSGNIYTPCLNGSTELVKNIDEKMEILSQKLDSELADSLNVTERTGIQVSTSPVGPSAVGNSLGNGTAADKTFASSRNQAKVTRTKKRIAAVAVAPAFRSNKKVSSLVDKWRAAKEELHGEEDDEPEDAYEIFEKKRKKEIEEWHAKQISSGEAQNNANFVPLRGDWRKRVKRKQTPDSSTISIQSPAEQVVKDKKQPDLVELARGLPPGWQAYWDESSKEVYYGNLKTSETTWTRPTS